MITELWQPLADYEEQYEISNHGRIRTLDIRYKGKVMRLEVDRAGYYVIKLVKFGITKKKAVHRITFENFVGPINHNEVIHHIDENKLNNVVTNLMKLTVSEHRSLHNKGVKPIYISN